jgi:hypothetical protein
MTIRADDKPDSQEQASAPGDGGPVALNHVIQTTPRYIVGISYPEHAAAYPPLARAQPANAQAAHDNAFAGRHGAVQPEGRAGDDGGQSQTQARQGGAFEELSARQ